MKQTESFGLIAGIKERRFNRNVLFIIILFVAIALRIYLALTQGDYMFLGTDDDNYRESAQILLKRGVLTYGGWPEPTVFIMPGYPVFLAALFAVFGSPNLLAVRVAQVLISSVGLWIAMWLGWKLGGEKAAVLSGFLTAIYPSNLTAPLFIMTETLFTVMLMVSLWCLVKSKEQKNVMWLVFTGISVGISIYFRPTGGLLPLFFMPYFLINRFSIKDVIKNTLIIGGMGLLIISPWIIRNYLVYRQFIPFTVSSGNPFLRGTYLDDKISGKFPWIKGERILSDKAQMELGKKRFIEGFRLDFKRYLSWYTVGKFKKLWAEPYYYVPLTSLPASLVGKTHRMFMWIGLAGIILGSWRKNDLIILFLSVSTYFTIVHQLFLAAPRYSYPVVQLVLIAAGYASLELYNFFTTLLQKNYI